MPPIKPAKSEETNRKILEAALDLFREQGFDAATMRAIAQKADVATGAAYYYPSKEALVMDFYRRACDEMQPKIEAALDGVNGLEARLRALIQVKLDHFQPNRGVLRALLRNGADPKYPLSPFSPDTKPIRDIDLAWFGRILQDCGFRIPRDLESALPGVLWFLQMGVIFFWVIDESPKQIRTTKLLDLAVKSTVTLIRLSGLPLMRPVRKTALQLIDLVKETRLMNDRNRGMAAVAIVAALLAAGYALMQTGVYGLTIFLLLPAIAGALVVWAMHPDSFGRACLMGALAGGSLPLLVLLFALDGLVCVLMALPLAALLGALGGSLAYEQ